MSTKEPTRILYGMGSPNVRKVALMLEELGLDYGMRHVSVYAGDQFTPEFMAMNPLSKVPVLIDPGAKEPLFESCAILIHLAETYGPAFLPATGAARREVLRWLMVQTAQMGPMLGQYNHFHLVVQHGTEPYSAARYRNQAETVFTKLDQRLADHEWFAGGAYSIADVAIWPWALYLERQDFAPADFPNLIRWRDRIAARPAAIRAQARVAAEFDPAHNARRLAASAEDLNRYFNRRTDGPPADFSLIQRA